MAQRHSPSKINHDPSMTVLDAYFVEMAKGPEHITRLAILLWNALSPARQLELQLASRALAGDDLRLSALHTQSTLVLNHLSDTNDSHHTN